MSGDISGCHISRDGNETGIERVEARGAAHHPAMHGADPTSKNGLLGWRNLVCVDTEVPKTHDQRSFQERKMTGRRNSEGMRGRDLRVGRRGGGGDALGRRRVT